MLYRSASQLVRLDDYTLGPPDTVEIAGGKYSSGAMAYHQDSSYTLREPVTAFRLILGSWQIDGVTLDVGQYLLHRVSDTLLRVYQTPVGGGSPTLVREVSRAADAEPFSLKLLKGAVLSYLVLSRSVSVQVLNLPQGSRLDSLQAQDGTIIFDLLVGRDATVRVLYSAMGGEIDRTLGPIYPGDTLFYVPPDYSPQPNGDGYQLSQPHDTLQQRVEALDTAFVQGGLRREGPMLQGLSYPLSSSYLPMGSLTYRLNDASPASSPVQTFTVNLEASKNGARVTVEVDSKRRTLELREQAHFVGAPEGFAIGSGTDGACVLLGLERNEYGELFFYEVGAAQPACDARDSSGIWHAAQMPYVVPGGSGTLIDRRLQVRRTAGPYLFLRGQDRHSTLGVLAGGADVSSDTFVGMVVNGRVRHYAVVGRALFDSRLAVLVKGD